MAEAVDPQDVIAFWRESGPDRWFAKDEAFDVLCRDRFLGTYEGAAAGRLAEWEATPDGALALVILLDQIPRNVFRGDARTWWADPLALAVAERAIARRFDLAIERDLSVFLYLPFEHAESVAHQLRSVDLFEAHGDAENLKWARHHHDIVARFGRFPHRNVVLGRKSSSEELAFLETDPFRG